VKLPLQACGCDWRRLGRREHPLSRHLAKLVTDRYFAAPAPFPFGRDFLRREALLSPLIVDKSDRGLREIRIRLLAASEAGAPVK
jgi:hypothetical protein